MLCMTQSEKIGRLSIPMTEERFESQRALGQYIGVNCRPDICSTVQMDAPGNMQIGKARSKLFLKKIEHMMEEVQVGLDFGKLDLGSARVAVLSDASFANAAEMKTQ